MANSERARALAARGHSFPRTRPTCKARGSQPAAGAYPLWRLTQQRWAAQLRRSSACGLPLDGRVLAPCCAAGGELDPLHPRLVAALMHLQPQFLRFPGGAIVEGVTLATTYRCLAHAQCVPSIP